LNNARFRAYLAASAAADTGFWIYTVASGWLVLTLTDSPFWLGAIAACGQIPYLLFSLYGGTLADRFDRRGLIAGGNAILAAVALVLAASVASGHATIAVLAVLAFAIGTIVALEHPVDRAWLYDLVRGEELARAIALSSLEWSVARTFGPALGGLAVATAGAALGFAAFALLVVPMSALALVLGRTPAHGRDGAPHRAPSAQGDSVTSFALLVAAFTIGIAPYITLLPDIAKHVLALDARGYGILSAGGGAGAIVAALALAKVGSLADKGRIVPIAMLAAAALLVALCYARSITLAGTLLFALVATDTLVYALANTYVQECAGDDERGRANGIFSLAFLGGIPIGNIAVGSLAGRIGTEPALVVAATFSAIACALFWTLAPRARDAA